MSKSAELVSNVIVPVRFRKEALISLAVLVVWGSLVAVLSANGVWTSLPRWAFPLTTILGVLVPCATYFRNSGFRALIDSIPLRNLTLFHAWRIIAGLYFLILGSEGFLPAGFTHKAGSGDVAVGLASLLFVLGRPSIRWYRTFHLFSLADLVVAVFTGLTFTALGVPGMEHIQTFPVALIPGFGVGIAASLSLITLYRSFKSPQEIT